MTEVETMAGFDPAGDPEIRRMNDGSLWLIFNFMPPSDVRDEEEAFFDDFDRHLEKAVGVPVTWDDREVFVIQQPRADSVERIRRFVGDCRRLAGSKKTSKRARVKERLKSALGPLGFKWAASQSGWGRRRGQTAHILWNSQVDRGELVLGFGAGIRIDAVEALKQRASGEPDDPWMVTLLWHCDFYAGHRYHEYSCGDLAAVDAALDDFCATWLPRFLADLERFEDPLQLIGAIDLVRDGIPFTMQDPVQLALSDLALHWLYARGRFDARVAHHRARCAGFDPEVMAPVERLLAVLARE